MRDDLTALHSDALIRTLTQKFVAQQLPKQEWTHAAHFAAALCLHREHDDVEISSDLRALIRAHNESVGTPNTDQEGYHETLTQFYAELIVYVCKRLPGADMNQQLAAIMSSCFGDRTFPLEFWSKPVLFSVDARRNWVAPDVRPLEFDAFQLRATV